MDLLKRWSVGGVALIALSMGMPIAAHADTFLINQDNLGIGCAGPAGCGTITVTGVGTTYTFTVDLTAASGLTLHSVNGIPDAVAFNLAGVSSTGFTGPISEVTSAPIPPMEDGFGSFLFGVKCSTRISGNICVPNGVSPSNEFTFTVQAPAGETLTANSNGNFAGLDVAMTGATGFAASNTHAVPGPVVGAGLPGIVVACGGLLALARRRRQRLALGNALSRDWFFAGLARRWRQLIA
jgi:hypothetical protein